MLVLRHRREGNAPGDFLMANNGGLNLSLLRDVGFSSKWIKETLNVASDVLVC